LISKLEGFYDTDFSFLTWTKTDEELKIEVGILFEEGHEFLNYFLLKRAKVTSKKTWSTYSHHMASFFTFCEGNNQNWKAIGDEGENEMLLFLPKCLYSRLKRSNNSNNHTFESSLSFIRLALGKV
jgi:integrase/recombinase XerD